MHDYLTIADVLAMHHTVLQRYGGSVGVRDLGALESALFRPQCGYYKDIIQEASALLESIVINHPFIDGNKRVAFAATDTFLRVNGYLIRASWEEVYNNIFRKLDTRDFFYKDIESYFRGNTFRKG